MSELRKVAAYPSMYLDDRLSDGHIVICTGGDTEHSFCCRRLGVSVECPICGQIALSVDLVEEFYGARVTAPAGTKTGRCAPLSLETVCGRICSPVINAS
jgi:hypothetical protein